MNIEKTSLHYLEVSRIMLYLIGVILNIVYHIVRFFVYKNHKK